MTSKNTLVGLERKAAPSRVLSSENLQRETELRAAGQKVRLIQLTKGMAAIVDEENYEWLNQWNWYTSQRNNRSAYAVRVKTVSGKHVSIHMHRLICNCPAKLQTHHKSGDGLDNRSCNLQPVTRSQNMRSIVRKKLGATSKYRGVYMEKASKKWRAVVNKGGRLFYSGIFFNEEDAARARDAKALELFGSSAYLNFPHH